MKPEQISQTKVWRINDCRLVIAGTIPLAIENRQNAAINRSGRPVVQFDLDGNEIARFRGQNEAGRLTGVSGANISQVCKGKRKQAGGFIWRYAI